MEQISDTVYHLDELVGGPTVLVATDYLTLIDTGLPGSDEAILRSVESLGRHRRELRHVLITHADPDHIGGLPLIVAATGADVYAGAKEADVVEGLTPGRDGHLRVPTPVTHRLRGGQTLPLHGGIEVIEAFGHTLGHIAFLLLADSVLIAGDCLTNRDRLTGSAPEYTADTRLAQDSLRKVAALAPRTLCFGHGPSLVGDAGDRLQELLSAEGLSSSRNIRKHDVR